MGNCPNPLEQASDHVVWEHLKLQDAAAWELAFARAVLPETESLRSGQKARDWGIGADELWSMLYVEMVGSGKLSLYRDDGGSLWGWMRTYVRGYINQARPDPRNVSIEGAGSSDAAEEGRNFEEKISADLSDSGGWAASPKEDPVASIQSRETRELVQACFAELFLKNPMRAYAFWLRQHVELSSKEIKDMLGMSSVANVDQTYARAVKDMGKLMVEHDERE